VKPGKRES